MTSCPVVAVAWFAAVSLAPIRQQWRLRFSDHDHAKAGDRLGEIRNGTRLPWRFPQEKAMVTPNPAAFDPFGKNLSGNRLSWRSRFFPLELLPKPAAFNRVWGKSNGKPFIMAVSPEKGGAYAKTGDLRAAWENSQRNPFIMAIAKQREIRLTKPFGLAKP